MADTKQFKYSGINTQGKRVTGAIEAIDLKDAQTELKKIGVEAITLTSKQQLKFFTRQKKIRMKDVMLFTRFLATMLASGLPLVQALDIISHEQENPAMQALLTSMKDDISGGKTLAETFAQHPNQFNDLYCSLVRAGEKSGTLDKILNRLAFYLERSESLKQKIRKALMYPIAVLSVAFIVSAVLLIFVVPQFQTMFASFGAQLPYFTLFFLELSNFIRHYWLLILISIIIFIFGFRWAWRKYKGLRRKFSQWALKLYIIGGVLQKGIIARFTRTLSTTLDAGMPIVESMKSMAPVMGNSLYTEAVMRMSTEISSGHSLSASMISTKLFPPMVVQMVSIGEISGKLSDMLNKVADFYEEEVNTIVDNLSTLLEPFIMVLLGIIVGSFVVAMYLPIFRMGSLF